MKKLVIIDECDVSKYDLGAVKRNLCSDIFIWKNNNNEKQLLKLLRKYDYFIILGDKYLYETIQLLKSEVPFSYFKFNVEYKESGFFKKYTLRNNLGKYLKEAFSRKRAGK